MNKTLLPKLRFPEFQDAPEWEEKTLGELGDVVASGDLNIEHFSPTPSLQHIYPVYSNSIGQEGLYGYYSVSKYPKDSVTITARGTLGVAFIRKQDFMGIGRLIVVSDLKDTNPKFLTESWNHLVTIPQEVTSIPQLTAVTAKSTVLPFPLLPEQQKIADCLTSLDDLIAAQSQKVETLQAYKKGLMQNLFPAEGESVPRLRFPEFESAGEWEEKKLEDVCERIMDGTHFSPKSKSGSRMYLTSKNIQNGIIDLSNVSYITEEEHRPIYDKTPVRINDVLLTKDGANTGNCAINNIDVEFSLLSSVAVLRGNPLLIDQRFLYQTILSDRTQNLIQDSMSGQAITRITLEKIAKFSIAVTTIAEQQRIAELLSALNEEITAQGEALAALKVHKRGLMQGLFPRGEQTSEVLETSEV